MKEIAREKLSEIRGGSASWIASLISSGFNFLNTIVLDIESGIIGNQALHSGADSVSLDIKNGKISKDNTKSNLAKYDLEMQKLKEFGAPNQQQLLLM